MKVIEMKALGDSSKEEKTCTHCGGIMRYYLGSWSCMMCGRDVDHKCPRCAKAVAPMTEFKKTA